MKNPKYLFLKLKNFNLKVIYMVSTKSVNNLLSKLRRLSTTQKLALAILVILGIVGLYYYFSESDEKPVQKQKIAQPVQTTTPTAATTTQGTTVVRESVPTYIGSSGGSGGGTTIIRDSGGGGGGGGTTTIIREVSASKDSNQDSTMTGFGRGRGRGDYYGGPGGDRGGFYGGPGRDRSGYYGGPGRGRGGYYGGPGRGRGGYFGGPGRGRGGYFGGPGRGRGFGTDGAKNVLKKDPSRGTVVSEDNTTIEDLRLSNVINVLTEQINNLTNKLSENADNTAVVLNNTTNQMNDIINQLINQNTNLQDTIRDLAQSNTIVNNIVNNTTTNNITTNNTTTNNTTTNNMITNNMTTNNTTNIIDGGMMGGEIMDGGIMDGGMMDGGIMDGGIMDGEMIDGGMMSGEVPDLDIDCNEPLLNGLEVIGDTQLENGIYMLSFKNNNESVDTFSGSYVMLTLENGQLVKPECLLDTFSQFMDIIINKGFILGNRIPYVSQFKDFYNNLEINRNTINVDVKLVENVDGVKFDAVVLTIDKSLSNLIHTLIDTSLDFSEIVDKVKGVPSSDEEWLSVAERVLSIIKQNSMLIDRLIPLVINNIFNGASLNIYDNKTEIIMCIDKVIKLNDDFGTTTHKLVNNIFVPLANYLEKCDFDTYNFIKEPYESVYDNLKIIFESELELFNTNLQPWERFNLKETSKQAMRNIFSESHDEPQAAIMETYVASQGLV